MPAPIAKRAAALIPILGATAFALGAFGAHAACLPSADPELQALEERMGRDPAAVATIARERLAAASAGDRLGRAALYALLSDALSSLDLYDEASRAAQDGLALVDDERSPEYLNLLRHWASNTVEADGVRSALETVEAVRAAQPSGSAAEACMLITLGMLEHQANRPDQASIHLTRAYRMSVGQERRVQRVMAADTLSVVMRELGDFAQALELNQEVLDWDVERNAAFDLATTRFIRGSMYRDMGDHAAALPEFAASRRLSEQKNDVQGVALADLLTCTALIEIGSLRSARTRCEEALQIFSASEAADSAKAALTALARIDLQEGDARAALERLDRVLDQEGRDILPRRLPQAYELRARAHAALGRYEQALADFENYLQRYKAAHAEDRARQAAALRAQFETDREIERNAFLQQELALKDERLLAQSQRVRWLLVAILAGGCMAALLGYLLHANRRQRRLLSQLALQDDLTRLPNRRRTFELANEAFEAARRRSAPLTIGILDLDHFKSINDRFGHAAGDFVLEQFARLGRKTIREHDVLGRWGGEEFLLVLPDTTLDVALAVVERVRQATATIKGAKLAEELCVSLSAGLATNEGDPTNLDEVVARADAALYDAKNGGRDLVCIAPQSYSLAATGVRRSLKSAGVKLDTGAYAVQRRE